MNVQINAVGFNVREGLEEYINKKIGKLPRYNDGIMSADVILKVEKDDNLENKLVEVNVDIKGGPVFAKKQGSTFEEATDQVFEALKRQLVKNKEKLKAK
jgi:ribosomal subunit interface protein